MAGELHAAASAGDVERVQRLIDEHPGGINVKHPRDGYTPLHEAAREGHMDEVIQLLIEAGSPINAQDHVGDTPLHDAALQGQVEAAQILVEAGADVNVKNNEGKTPLDLAEQHGHGSVAEALKAAGGER